MKANMEIGCKSRPELSLGVIVVGGLDSPQRDTYELVFGLLLRANMNEGRYGLIVKGKKQGAHNCGPIVTFKRYDHRSITLRIETDPAHTYVAELSPPSHVGVSDLYAQLERTYPEHKFRALLAKKEEGVGVPGPTKTTSEDNGESEASNNHDSSAQEAPIQSEQRPHLRYVRNDDDAEAMVLMLDVPGQTCTSTDIFRATGREGEARGVVGSIARALVRRGYLTSTDKKRVYRLTEKSIALRRTPNKNRMATTAPTQQAPSSVSSNQTDPDNVLAEVKTRINRIGEELRELEKVVGTLSGMYDEARGRLDALKAMLK